MSATRLSRAAVAACARAARRQGWPPQPEAPGGAQPPVLLSYATNVASHWLLGLSAAAHGLPLAVAGLGMPGWPWWEGGRKQLPGSRRALQVLDALVPRSPILLTDH
eukprot:7014695-Prymnesium_polylepis.1